MTRSASIAVAFAAFASGQAACSGTTSGPDGGGVCRTSHQSCAASADCCAGFACLGEVCTFTGSGNSGGAQTNGSSGGGSGGSTGRATGSTGSSGSNGGSTGTTGGGGCAAFGASCQASACCDPYDGDAGTGYVCLYGATCELCEAQGSFCDQTSDCCGGLTCTGSSCSVPTLCTPYDESCASVPCCGGLSCDPTAQTCYLSDGGSCAGGETCVSPFSCLPTGDCGIPTGCAGYGQYCGATNCCSGLTCDPTYDFCYVGNGAPCAGRICDPPDTCVAGTCGPATGCSTYGTSCATTACCPGFTCDSTSMQCGVADGGPCAFSDGGTTVEYCAPPFACTPYGICGTTIPCGGYGSSGCIAGGNCCPGLTCDATYNGCYDAPGASCSGVDTYCANGGTCDGGVCGPAATCGAYGLACTLGCCTGLTCDTTYSACYDALGAPCTGTDSYCANGNVCSAGVCAISSSCTAYGGSCASTVCCSGLTCDSSVDVCYIADGYDCLNQTCATPYSCLPSDVCG